MSNSDSKVKTTLHGKPMQTQTDATSRSMEGGLGPGPNTSHPGFTDKSLVRIPIKVSDYLDLEAEEEAAKAKAEETQSTLSDTSTLQAGDPSIQRPEKEHKVLGIFRSRSPKPSHNRKGPGFEGFKAVLMTRGDYLRYWNKNEDGEWDAAVTEPPEGRAEWLRKQLVWQEEWSRSAPGKSAQQKEWDLKAGAVSTLAFLGTAVIGGAS